MVSIITINCLKSIIRNWKCIEHFHFSKCNHLLENRVCQFRHRADFATSLLHILKIFITDYCNFCIIFTLCNQLIKNYFRSWVSLFKTEFLLLLNTFEIIFFICMNWKITVSVTFFGTSCIRYYSKSLWYTSPI